MFSRSLLPLFFLFNTLFYHAQNRILDSVRLLLHSAHDDRSRLGLLEAMQHYQGQLQNTDSAIYFGEEAVKAAVKLNAKTDLCDLYLGLGVLYKSKGKQPRAMELYLKSLRLAEEMKNKNRIADNYVCIGTLYDEKSQYDKALKNYYDALALYRELGNKAGVSMVTGDIGNVYYSYKKYDQALEFYLDALAIDRELDNKENLKYSLGYIGMVYSQLAKENKSKGDSLYHLAKDYYRHALEMSQELHDMRLVVNWLGNIGVAEADEKNYGPAEKWLLRALAIADSLEFTEEKVQFEQAVSELYYNMKDYKRSIDHYKIFTHEKDSMFTAEKERELTKHEMNYEFEKKMAAVRAEQEKKETMAEARSRQQKLIIISVITGLIILSVALIVILRALRTTRVQKAIIEKQKQIVDEKQKEIIDSIYYAKRIQQSLLATESYIHRSLSRLLKK